MVETVPVKEAILFLLFGGALFTLKDIFIDKFGKIINLYFFAFIVGIIVLFIFVFPDSISNLFTRANFFESTIIKRVVFILLSIIVLLITIILFLIDKSKIKF